MIGLVTLICGFLRKNSIRNNVFKRSPWKRALSSEEGNQPTYLPTGSSFVSCVTGSVNKMMLFSKHREVYQNYWNSLSSKQLLKNYFPNLRRKDHESKMSAILVKWFCTMENEYCLEQTKKNFDAVKNGELRNVSKTIHYKQLNKDEISHKTFKDGLILMLNWGNITKCLDWSVEIGNCSDLES